MKSVFFLSLLSALGMISAHAATVLHVAHYGANDPRSQGFSGPNPTSTNLTLEGVHIDGTDAWGITDPGIAPGGKSNSNNYTKSFTDDQLVSLLQNGWSMVATVNIPTDTPTSGVTWATSSQSWIGAYYKHATSIEGIATSNQRIAWGLMLGRNAEGKTVVGLYDSKLPNLVLDPGFHTYEWYYNPSTKAASVYVDGQYWTEYYGTVSNTATSNLFYWGDNNAQSVADNTPRTAYYSYVSYTIAPEPTVAWLSLLGVSALIWRRRRS